MAPGADMSGKWTLVADAGGQLIDISVELKQSGSDFTGGALSLVSGWCKTYAVKNSP